MSSSVAEGLCVDPHSVWQLGMEIDFAALASSGHINKNCTSNVNAMSSNMAITAWSLHNLFRSFNEACRNMALQACKFTSIQGRESCTFCFLLAAVEVMSFSSSYCD
jgi:hypothetical protein